MSQIESLSFSDWNTLSDNNLESLGHLENLQSLDVRISFDFFFSLHYC